MDRSAFQQKMLRNLGGGVVKTHVSQDQIEDATDKAIAYFHDIAEEATEEFIFKYQITQADHDEGANTITLPVEVHDVTEMLPVRRIASIDFEYDHHFQRLHNQFQTQYSGGMSDYYINKETLSLIRWLFSSSNVFTFTRYSNRVKTDLEIGKDIAVGDYLVFRAQRLIDPDIYNEFYDSRLLNELASAYLKKYQAINLTKLSNVSLMGGIKIDVDKLYDRATDEITKFEKAVYDMYSPSLGVYLG